MVRRKLEELNLVDNFLFGSVLNYPNLGDRFAKILLKIILEMEFGDLKIVPQRVFYGSNTDKHGTQLDVHIEASIAEDSGAEQENVIDLEPDHPQFKETVNLFHVMGVEVNISLADYNLGIPNQRIVKMGDLTVLSGNTQKMSLGDTIAKRVLDIIGGIVGLILTGFFVIIIGPAIVIESPGPIFFSQTRIGKNGRRFKIYKFRSMYMDAEERKKELMEKNKMSGLMFKMDDDPRITKVGKFIRKTSIDEFPQFWNVLKGDMSLVGTRPPTEDEFKQYKARYKKRLIMKPGITGIWQVSGRSSITDFEDVVKLDVQYIENWSFGLDLKILLQTVLVVLKHDGAQ